MNGALEKTLDELMKWREASIALLEEQEVIASNKNEEQATLVSLDGQFSSLLAGSQSLVEQAKEICNLRMAYTKHLTQLITKQKLSKRAGRHWSPKLIHWLRI